MTICSEIAALVISSSLSAEPLKFIEHDNIDTSMWKHKDRVQPLLCLLNLLLNSKPLQISEAAKGSSINYVITFGGLGRPPSSLCNIVIFWPYPPPM